MKNNIIYINGDRKFRRNRFNKKRNVNKFKKFSSWCIKNKKSIVGLTILTTIIVGFILMKPSDIKIINSSSSSISTNVLILIQKEDENSSNNKLRKNIIQGYYLEDNGSQYYQNNFVPNRYLYIR